MKKLVLILVVFLNSVVVYGQTEWGAWVQDPCFKGIYSRCRLKDYNDSAKQYHWDIQIKNNYGTKVSLNFDIQNSSVDGRTTIKPGETDTSWTLNPTNGTLYIGFSKVCFHHPEGFDQCSEYEQKGYASFADCDLGAPKYHVYNGVNSNNNANTTTSSSTPVSQQNDLTEYNRSKQEMEAKLERENAEINRQNQINNDKLQVYNAAVKAGVDAHNSGNYEEAKRQFTIAINNASPQDRQKAQDYYNASVSAEREQGKYKAVGDLAVTAINSYDEFVKANRERKRQKEETNDIRIMNDMMEEEFFDAFMGDVISTFIASGYEPSLITARTVKHYTASLTSISQYIGYDNFYLSMDFLYDEKVPSATNKSITVTCQNKETWEKILKSKVLKKGKFRATNKFEDKQFGPLMIVLTDFDKKNIKNYGTLAKAYKDFMAAHPEKMASIGDVLSGKKKAGFADNVIPDASGLNTDLLAAEQLFEKGKEYYKAKNFKNAFQYYSDAAKKGSSKAMLNMAYMYEDGEGVPEDYGKAMEWLLKAADLGDASAMYEIGGLYDDGEAIEGNPSKAAEWYLKAADKGNKSAMYNLAGFYLRGEAVPQDTNKAKEWYKKGCDSGHDKACEKLKTL